MRSLRRYYDRKKSDFFKSSVGKYIEETEWIT